MLRKPEDMKEWQKDSLQEDKIIGVKAPEGVPTDDLPDIPNGFASEVKPKKAPVKKKVTPKKKPIEKMEVGE